MDNGLVVFGAYGRSATVEDWRAGKDFRHLGAGGTYLSIRDSAEVRRQGYDGVILIDEAGKHVADVELEAI